MTLQQVYKKAYDKLQQNAQVQETCAFDLSCLFEHMLGVSRYRLPLIGNQEADEAKARVFFSLCKRYEAGEPLQYLIGEWEFYGLPFSVGEGVLIPRPDTETLVETALALLKDVKRPVVADLCSGSGCVAIAIAHERPDAQVFALELSDAAFPYLIGNISRNHAKVTALHHDVRTPPALPALDLVVSNPPYIPREEMDTLQIQVTHEPEMALFGGEDGYDFYRELPKLYLPLLKKDGAIAFEVGYNQAQTVKQLLLSSGYTDINTQKDLAGIVRVVSGRKL
ncbi:peptide chain release factor N(5)-glutamine methyltransferase [Oscillospiraceae bacterium PP1C4]